MEERDFSSLLVKIVSLLDNLAKNQTMVISLLEKLVKNQKLEQVPELEEIEDELRFTEKEKQTILNILLPLIKNSNLPSCDKTQYSTPRSLFGCTPYFSNVIYVCQTLKIDVPKEIKEIYERRKIPLSVV